MQCSTCLRSYHESEDVETVSIILYYYPVCMRKGVLSSYLTFDKPGLL